MSKVSVVGAGFVGATAAYAMLITHTASEITLVDVKREKAEGEAMDLQHGLQFIPKAKVTFSDSTDACKDSDVVVVCAGAHQKPGETRLDAVKTNAGIFKDLIPKIARAAPKAVLVIVANPVDALTFLARKYSGFPASRVIGTGTSLDTARFRYLLGEHFQVDPSSVHAYILGEHGDSSFPVWSSANIGGVNLRDFDGFSEKKMRSIAEKTRQAAYEIIARKGSTYYAIGLAITEIAQSIIGDKNKVLPVSVLLNNYQGVKDVCLSVPCAIGAGGVKRQLVVPFDAVEKKAFLNSASIIKKTIQGALG